jgi:hypothetical protein
VVAAEDAAADAREKVTQDEIAVWAIESDGEVVGFIQADEETEPSTATPRSTSCSRAAARIAAWARTPSGLCAAGCSRPAATTGSRSTRRPHNARAIRALRARRLQPVGVLRQYERAATARGTTAC